LAHVRSVQTDSGSISLQGVFSDPAQVRATSGSVDVTLAPESAVQIDAQSGSGSIRTKSLRLGSQRQERNLLQGTLGNPAAGAVLSINTRSGSITLGQ
jgi:DUF4097 and DUF4098 domain-containing protein YvlB